MGENRWKFFLTIALPLLFLLHWWGSEPTKPEKEEVEAVKMGKTEPIAISEEQCAGCPASERSRALSTGKRGAERDSFIDCQELLAQAAVAGNPQPDTSHLDDCYWSPLHFAETPEQIQVLLNAGADPNVQDALGRTPLYLQVEKAMLFPNEEGMRLVKALLDGEADPWLKTHEGKYPYDIARLKNTTGARELLREEELLRRLDERGLTLEEFLEKHPRYRELRQEWKRGPEIANRILAELIKAMKRTEGERRGV